MLQGTYVHDTALVLVFHYCIIQRAAAVSAQFEFIDNTERDNEVRSLKEIIVCIRVVNSSFFELRKGLQFQRQTSKKFET